MPCRDGHAVSTNSFERNKGARNCLVVTGAIQLLLGLISMALWSVMMVENDGASSPIQIGTGLWAGGTALIAGSIGICINMPCIETVNQYILMIVQFAFTMSFPGVITQQIIHSSQVWSDCRQDPLQEVYCQADASLFTDLAMACLVLGAVIVATFIPVFTCYMYIMCSCGKQTRPENDPIRIAPE